MVISDPRARRRGFLPPHGESVDSDTEEHDSAEGMQISVRINIRPKLKAHIIVAPSRFAPPRGRSTATARLSAAFPNYGDAARAPRRPPRKARGVTIPAVSE